MACSDELVALLVLQENGLVPIVEPEITLGPGTYTIEETAFWSERMYSQVFRLVRLMQEASCLLGFLSSVLTPSNGNMLTWIAYCHDGGISVGGIVYGLGVEKGRLRTKFY